MESLNSIWVMKTTYKILKVLAAVIFLLIAITILLFGRRDIPLSELKAKYGTAPSQFVNVDGMEVHYRDEGNTTDELPIVLIHGTGSSLHTFEGWTELLKRDYRVIRMDLPAYGLTGPFPDRDYSINSYVDFVREFLKKIGVDRCVIGGNSLGGEIAWNFTVKHPELVDRLILIDAAGFPIVSESVPIAFRMARVPVIKNLFTFVTPRFVAKSSVENVYYDKSKVTEELVDRYFELTLREGNRQAFVDRLNMDEDTDAWKNIGNIKNNTLVLWGEHDELIPMSHARRYRDELPNEVVAIIENSGHVPMEESPEESLVPVLEFLRN